MSKTRVLKIRLDEPTYDFLIDYALEMSKSNKMHVTMSGLVRFVIDYFFMAYLSGQFTKPFMNVRDEYIKSLSSAKQTGNPDKKANDTSQKDKEPLTTK
jgi:hypothetical protein